MRLFIILTLMRPLVLLLPCLLQALTLGVLPAPVTLSGDSGGRTNGSPWSSAEISGKVYCLLYVDPDERDANQPLFDALQKAAFPFSRYGFIAVINLKATLLPNFIIESLLKKNQKKHPQVIYVRDRKKVFCARWGLADNNSDILLFDKQGRLLFQKDGPLAKDEVDRVLALIRENLDK
jgi:uncharacterized protein